jgi:hypothetical protein
MGSLRIIVLIAIICHILAIIIEYSIAAGDSFFNKSLKLGINTDQGSQFTSEKWLEAMRSQQISSVLMVGDAG